VLGRATAGTSARPSEDSLVADDSEGAQDVTLVYILLTFVVVRTALNGIVPLVRGRPWIVDTRVEAVVFAGVLVLAIALGPLGLWPVAGPDAQAHAIPPPSLGFLVVFGMLLVGMSLSPRFSVIGVRDEDFRSALTGALRDGGYEYELRVDARERPSTIVLAGRWQGVEVTAWSSFATGNLRGKGASGHVVARELVDRLRTTFASGAHHPPLGPSLVAIALAGAVAAMFVMTLP